MTRWFKKTKWRVKGGKMVIGGQGGLRVERWLKKNIEG
jgi:hypothetical protein